MLAPPMRPGRVGAWLAEEGLALPSIIKVWRGRRKKGRTRIIHTE